MNLLNKVCKYHKCVFSTNLKFCNGNMSLLLVERACDASFRVWLTENIITTPLYTGGSAGVRRSVIANVCKCFVFQTVNAPQKIKTYFQPIRLLHHSSYIQWFFFSS